jgi:hypothetical protein
MLKDGIVEYSAAQKMSKDLWAVGEAEGEGLRALFDGRW